jgi:hypothetical protein
VSRADWALDATALVGIAIMLALLCIRSIDFGVDTAAYLERFRGYCAGHTESEADLSYRLSLIVLNGAMAGACHVDLVPGVWGLVFSGIVLGAVGAPRVRIRFLFLLLVSIVGIELTTNALRQGLSAATLVTGFSYWHRNRMFSVALCVVAVAFHSSALLVLAAILLSTVGTLPFVAGVGVLVALVLQAVNARSTYAVLEPFLYEVSKYIAHEGDEIYIRLLAAASLLAVCCAPLFCLLTYDVRSRLAKDPAFGVAVRLCITAVPFLFLPYFGYRYIYGIFPVVLWLVLSSMARVGANSAMYVSILGLANMLILLVWSYGSSYMREVRFLQW